MKDETTTFVGIDVSKDNLAVAVAEGSRGGDVLSLGTFPNRPAAIEKLLKCLSTRSSQNSICYEAGPTGYGLYRQVQAFGLDCTVVAPSLITVRAGERVKTDRLDAKRLARLFRAGELTTVCVPDETHEAMRDLVRARESAAEDQRHKRQLVSAFLLRHGQTYRRTKPWMMRYRRWLQTLSFEHPARLRIPMGWTPPHGIALCQGSGVETYYEKEASMEEASIVGLDIAKNTFHAHGAAPNGSTVFRKKLSRSQVLPCLSRQTPCTVAIEACASAHHWGREITALGHLVRLIAPQYVKPYVKRQKNDANDAEAIAEAASRPSMRFVAVKCAESQGQAMALKTRDLLTSQRTQSINALRGHIAEHGIIAPKGPQHVVRLEAILTERGAFLPETVVALCKMLMDQIRSLTARIDALSNQVRRIARENKIARNLATMPGIGPITAVALATLAPPPDSFEKGRDFSAWIGLTPKQHSTGGKTRLGRTSKMGQRDLRRLLIIGAMSVIQAAERRGGAPTGTWLAKMLARKPKMLVAVALANKMARTSWALITRGGVYETPARA